MHSAQPVWLNLRVPEHLRRRLEYTAVLRRVSMLHLVMRLPDEELPPLETDAAQQGYPKGRDIRAETYGAALEPAHP